MTVYNTTAYLTHVLAYNFTTDLNTTSADVYNATISRVDQFGENGTLQNTSMTNVICNNATDAIPKDSRTSHDALLYIVTVLLFYSLSMVILMVKYIRREREEAEMAHYYSEFVSRDKFKTPKFEIQNYMKLLKYKQEYICERSKGASNESGEASADIPLVSDDNKRDEPTQLKDVLT